MPPQNPPLPGWDAGLPGRADARTHPARPLPRGVPGRGAPRCGRGKLVLTRPPAGVGRPPGRVAHGAGRLYPPPRPSGPLAAPGAMGVDLAGQPGGAGHGRASAGRGRARAPRPGLCAAPGRLPPGQPRPGPQRRASAGKCDFYPVSPPREAQPCRPATLKFVLREILRQPGARRPGLSGAAQRAQGRSSARAPGRSASGVGCPSSQAHGPAPPGARRERAATVDQRNGGAGRRAAGGGQGDPGAGRQAPAPMPT